MTDKAIQSVANMLNSAGDILDSLSNMHPQVLDPKSWVCLAARSQIEVIGRLTNQVAENVGEGPWSGFARHCESISDHCGRAVILLAEGIIPESEDNESWEMWVLSIGTDIGDALSVIPQEMMDASFDDEE